MQAIAWTVFQGSKPEAVPVEIVGIWENAWGPKQNIIIGKMGGKADPHQRGRRHERQPCVY